MSDVFEYIRTEAANDTVTRLNRAVRHLVDVDEKINEAIAWGDLGPELAAAHMLVGELLEETPALSRTISFKVADMLATDQGSSVYTMYARWQAEAQAALEQSLDDGFRAGADAGGTFTLSYRGGLEIDGSNHTRAGADLVHDLLLTTGSETLVAQDEFQLIVLHNGKYVLVLPGVTDLSAPDIGLDDRHRTVRDLDRYALESAASTGIAGNEYARMVQIALDEAGVPPGSDVAILGHSFGADTALDLAADPGFNGGPDGYNVTHVIAAGYHSGPQLEHVDDSTSVLVLQNHHDLAILAESWGHRPGEALHADGPVATKMHTVPGEALVGTAIPIGQAIVDAGGFAIGSVFNLGGDVVNHVGGLAGFGDGEIVHDVHLNDFDDIFLKNDGVTQPRANQVVDVFEGAWQGVGHHPDNYAAHVATTDHPSTLAFFESLGAAGYDGRMERWSVDVSVPERQ